MKRIKKLLSVVLVGLLMLCISISFFGCFQSPKNGNKKLHGTWYVYSVKFNETWYQVEEYNTQILGKDHPLTYDCFILNFLENGEVELHSLLFKTLTGTLTNFVNKTGYGLECSFEFTLGDKCFSGYIEQIGGFMDNPFMQIQGAEKEQLATFERYPHGYSYDEYKQK